MAEKNNATCSICGKPYYMCGSCKDEMSLTPWKVHTDTSEHFKIFQIIRGHSTGVYTASEAKAKFKNVDLSDLESLRENIKDIIKGIIGDAKNESFKVPELQENVFPKNQVIPKEETLAKEETFVSVAPSIETAETVAVESVDDETVMPRRRKRFK